jgi:hypothetical protein
LLIQASILAPEFGGAAGALVGPLAEAVGGSSDAEFARVVLCDSVEKLRDDVVPLVVSMVVVDVEFRL